MSGAARERLLLVAWLVLVVVITMLHDPWLLGALLVGVLLLHRRDLGLALRRTLATVAVVNLAVSIGLVLVAVQDHRPWLEPVLRLNLRILVLALLTLWVVRRVRLERALDGLPALQFLVVLVQGQIRTLGRTAAECRQALDSRTAAPLRWRDRMRGADRQLGAVMSKAELQSEALIEGMQSRGFFDARA